MALNASVQKLVDEVAETKGLKEAVVAGFDLTSKQITELKDLIATLQAGQTIDAENLAAINKAVDDLDQTNEQLKVAVPANTPTGGEVTPAADVLAESPVGGPTP